MVRFALFMSVCVVVCATTSAKAENLNQKYGPSWNCSYITAGMPIYDACKPCQDKGMDFYRDSETTGHCVPRPDDDTPPPAAQTRPSPPANKVEYYYIVRACNKTGRAPLFVALGTNDDPSNVHAMLRGWWSLGLNECKDLIKLPFRGYLSQVAFLHAQAGDKFWPAKAWIDDPKWTPQERATNNNGKPSFCVSLKGFEWQTTEDASFYNRCANGQEMRAFSVVWIERSDAQVTVKEVEYR